MVLTQDKFVYLIQLILFSWRRTGESMGKATQTSHADIRRQRTSITYYVTMGQQNRRFWITQNCFSSWYTSSLYLTTRSTIKMVKTNRIPGTTFSISTLRRSVKKNQTNSSKKRNANSKRIQGTSFGAPYDWLNGTIVKYQGPRFCSPRRVKLYFPQQARLMLGSLDTQCTSFTS